MHLISVIVPTFNRASVLFRALDSVVKQMYSNWELIVVDDGSSDGTQDQFVAWQQALGLHKKTRLVSSSNHGVSHARNLGVRNSNGRWLAFLDSDDEWLSDKLTRQMPLTQNFRWVHGEESWIRNGAPVQMPRKYQKSGGRIFSRCVELCCVGASTVLIERDVFEEAGGFREDFPVCEDYDLWLKLSSRHNIGLAEGLVINKYGGHADQLSRRFSSMDYFRCVSLGHHLNNENLSDEERIRVEQELARKSQILLGGLAKRLERQP